jgi:hypothetical protein
MSDAMREYIKTMRDAFYKAGWGQNEVMWKCWNQGHDYALASQPEREKKLVEFVLRNNIKIVGLHSELKLPEDLIAEFTKENP